MMFRGLMRLGAGDREPVVDNHPLARPDGGWYPGKRFDPTDILTDPGNWLVWKQFLIFFFSVLIIPVAVFVIIEWLLRTRFHLHFQQSQTIGALVSVVCLQGLMFYYARLAVSEDKADRIAEAASAAKPQEDQLETADVTPVESGEKQIEGELKDIVETGTAPVETPAVGAETTAVQRRGEGDESRADDPLEQKKEA